MVGEHRGKRQCLTFNRKLQLTTLTRSIYAVMFAHKLECFLPPATGVQPLQYCIPIFILAFPPKRDMLLLV